MRKLRDERIPVWVVDDQDSLRLATAATVAATQDFVMAGECETGESAIELLRDGGAGVVLMDIHMPGMGGIEASGEYAPPRRKYLSVTQRALPPSRL